MKIDPNALIPGSKYFRWREFLRSATAAKLGIDNTPPKDVQDNIIYLTTNVLEPLREALGPIVITSGYRCDALNNAVQGAKGSFHRFGNAADIRSPAVSPVSLRQIFTHIHEKLPYTELIAEEIPDGWVHVALARGRETEHQLKYKLPGKPLARGSYDYIQGLFA